MSAEPQPPVERFLDVPDLAGNVFERLDPASRRTFFQSHPHVACAGPVLAQSKLYIELNPTSSMEDQWQRVLRLTRSQPPRCLVLAGPSKEYLLDFVHSTPQGIHDQKRRVLQGTELQVQLLIKLDTGGMPQLQSHLSSWREEQRQGVQGAISFRLVLCLCGRVLDATTEAPLPGPLEPPSCCTLRNGTLLQLYASIVRVGQSHVRLEDLALEGVGKQVEVLDGGDLEMVGCHVQGGGRDESCAVRVLGSSARLYAERTSMRSSSGSGLVVGKGGRAVLEHCTVSDGMWGVDVIGQGSTLHAAQSHIHGSERTNLTVTEGGHASLEGVSSNGSKAGHGIEMYDPDSSIRATDSAMCGNKSSGAFLYTAASRGTEKSSLTMV